MKAEHLRMVAQLPQGPTMVGVEQKNVENLESLDRLKCHFQSFLYLFLQGPTHKRQNKSLVHQNCADFVGFS